MLSRPGKSNPAIASALVAARAVNILKWNNRQVGAPHHEAVDERNHAVFRRLKIRATPVRATRSSLSRKTLPRNAIQTSIPYIMSYRRGNTAPDAAAGHRPEDAGIR